MPRRVTEQVFLERARRVASSLDDLTDVVFESMRKKIKIRCKSHGYYLCIPSDYLNGHRCPKCSNVEHGYNESFVSKARKKHGDKYSYANVSYLNSKTKVSITCPMHGDFQQRPNDHLNGYGCPKCASKGSLPNGRLTTEEFIARARLIHGDKYDYSNVVYHSAKEKVIIVCPMHGRFEQIPNNHLSGSNCPKCSKIAPFSKMASGVCEMLREHGFDIEIEKTFDWLRNERNLKLDFYLPKYNIGIEVQGEQHFVAIPRFGGNEGLTNRKKLDSIKKKLCDEHNVKLFYVTKSNYSINEVLSYINGCGEKKEASKEA